MKVDIGNNNEQSVYYNKARLEYANNGNVININYKIAKYDNKIKAICNIIAKLNDFTESENRIYTNILIKLIQKKILLILFVINIYTILLLLIDVLISLLNAVLLELIKIIM